MSNYDDALRETYRFPAAALASAAVVGRFIGPAGKTGRIVNVSHIVTTDVTVAAGTVTVGPNGAVGPVTHTVPVSAAGAGGAIPYASLNPRAISAQLPADTVIEVAAGGQPTAGAGDLIVTVDWY